MSSRNRPLAEVFENKVKRFAPTSQVTSTNDFLHHLHPSISTDGSTYRGGGGFNWTSRT